MSGTSSNPSREDVLNAFAMEPELGHKTLEDYLREFPEYSSDLVDLSAELSKPDLKSEVPLSEAERKQISSQLARFRKGKSNATSDPFAPLSLSQLRHVAKSLNIPRQILTAFRERLVLVSSIPRPFLQRLATSLESNVEEIVSYLEQPPSPIAAKSHKALEKPEVRENIEFEQLLVEAGVADELRAEFLAE